jgi:hypothetical protein
MQRHRMGMISNFFAEPMGQPAGVGLIRRWSILNRFYSQTGAYFLKEPIRVTSPAQGAKRLRSGEALAAARRTVIGSALPVQPFGKTARKDRMRSITKGWKIFGTEIGKKKPETLVFEMELGFWAGATVVMKILDEDGASPEVLARLCAEVRAYQHEMCDLRDAIMRNHYSNEQMFGEK